MQVRDLTVDEVDLLQVEQIHGAKLVAIESRDGVPLQIQHLGACVQPWRNLGEIGIVAADALLAVLPLALAEGGAVGGGQREEEHGQEGDEEVQEQRQ